MRRKASVDCTWSNTDAPNGQTSNAGQTHTGETLFHTRTPNGQTSNAGQKLVKHTQFKHWSHTRRSNTGQMLGVGPEV
eukprot:2610514-Rhodomonas_salina.1